MSNPKTNRALFLDRDGVINVDHHYVSRIADFEWMPHIFELLKTAARRGYKLIIVTNQSGIARGHYTKEDFLTLTKWMLNELKTRDIWVAGVYYCPHAPEENCECRKPKAGLFLQAITDHALQASQCVMVGDNTSDIEAANAAGITKTLLIGGHKTLLDTILLLDKKPPTDTQ